METATISALIGIVSGLLAGGLAGWLSFVRLKKENAGNIQQLLYTKQLHAYSSFWHVVLESSNYGRPDCIVTVMENGNSFNKKVAQQFIEKVRIFHSSEEGIYLSNELADQSFKTISTVAEVLESKSEYISNNKTEKILGGIGLMKYHLRHDINLRQAQPAKQLLGEVGA